MLQVRAQDRRRGARASASFGVADADFRILFSAGIRDDPEGGVALAIPEPPAICRPTIGRRIVPAVSWDVLFQDLPTGVKSLDDIPDDFKPKPLGPREHVVDRLLAEVPGIDFSDASWGTFEGEGFSVEFNMGTGSVTKSVMLHVRGGDAALAVVRAVADALGVPAIDCSQGELIDLASPEAAEGFRAWRAYRDHVLVRKE
jgi:hypothetical protein